MGICSVAVRTGTEIDRLWCGSGGDAIKAETDEVVVKDASQKNRGMRSKKRMRLHNAILDQADHQLRRKPLKSETIQYFRISLKADVKARWQCRCQVGYRPHPWKTMRALKRFYRSQEIQRIKSGLERAGFPRLQMLLLVALTGAAGFFASFILLRAGLGEMWIRFLVSFGFAYAAFLALLWLWLRTRAEDYSDLCNNLDMPTYSESSSAEVCFSGKGGSFDGGGASGDFDSPVGDLPAADDTGPLGDALGSVADADELAIPLFVIILIGALLLSSIFMIYSAPILFAELIVDGVLSASLYRKLRGLQTRHWLQTALSRTAWPFVLTASIVSASGWAMALYAPQAHSVGEVIAYSRQGNPGPDR